MAPRIFFLKIQDPIDWVFDRLEGMSAQRSGRQHDKYHARFKGRRMKASINRPLSRSSTFRNAKAIARLNKRTGGFMGLELKFFDTSLATPSTMSGNGDLTAGELDPPTVNCLNAMVQGTGEQERLGRFINMTSVKVKGTFLFPVAEALGLPAGAQFVTIFLVLDKETNAAQLNSEDVFTNKAATADLINHLFINMENTDRFQILDSDRVTLHPEFVLQNETGVTYARGEVKHSWSLSYRWKRGKKVLFKGTAGTVANIQDNSLHVIGYCKGAVTVDYNARLRYTTT